MKSIGFIVGTAGAHFLTPIGENLKEDYIVIPIDGLRRDWFEQCDIIWVEWGAEAALSMVPYLEGLKEAGKKIICRIHSYEVFSDFLPAIDWSRYSDIIWVADNVKQVGMRVADMRSPRHHVIWNGIKVEDYPLQDYAGAFPKRIVCFGSINHKKGHQLLLHAFAALYKQDEEFQLAIIGDTQEQRYIEYISHMAKELGVQGNIELLSERPPQEAFKDAGYVAIASPWEGCPVGVLEGMAMGCYPLIHSFPGSDKLYAPSLLWSAISDFVFLAKDRRKYEGDSRTMRRMVEVDFGFERMMKEVRYVLEGQ